MGIPVYASSQGVSSLPSMSDVPVQPSYVKPLSQTAGIYNQIQQSPDWLQNYIKTQTVNNPNMAGFYDPSLQARDIYSSLQQKIGQAQRMYGDQFNDPYFAQAEFDPQTSQKAFDPFLSNLNDYEIRKSRIGGDGRYANAMGGNIYSIQRDPFTGEEIGPGSLASSAKPMYQVNSGDPFKLLQGYRSGFQGQPGYNRYQEYAPLTGVDYMSYLRGKY